MLVLVTGENGWYFMSSRKHHWMLGEDSPDEPIMTRYKRYYLILIDSSTFERRLMIQLQTKYPQHWVYLPGNVMQGKRFIKALK